MTREETNAYLCVILETVSESKSGVPSGHMYAAFMTKGITLDEYQSILGIAQRGGLVEVKSHLVTLTPKGQEMVEKIHAFTLTNRSKSS
jgi:predicted methyltransferase